MPPLSASNDGKSTASTRKKGSSAITTSRNAKRSLIVSCVVSLVLLIRQFSTTISLLQDDSNISLPTSMISFSSSSTSNIIPDSNQADSNQDYLDTPVGGSDNMENITATTTTSTNSPPPFLHHHHRIHPSSIHQNKNKRNFGSVRKEFFPGTPSDGITGGRYYTGSPFRKGGYKPAGGALPVENADYLSSERMWRWVDNTTCVISLGNNSNNRNNGHYQQGDGYDSDSITSTLSSWQHRAPYAIILGAMKCGTHALTESLWEHPWVARNRHWELHFFDSDRPVRGPSGIDQLKTQRAYATAFRKASPEFFRHLRKEQNDDPTHNTTKMIAIESSPRYLLSSDRLPHLILCTVPMVKFMVLVRDPIARVESQYRYLDEVRRTYGKPMVDWTTWIDDDMRLLHAAGVLNATTREDEKVAWKRYQRKPNSNMIVGRGLYVLQLLDYIEAMEEYNKSRDGDLLVLQSERFRQHRQEEYNKVLKFLNLPPHKLQNATEEIHPTLYKGQSTPMPTTIRTKLQSLYHPYNQRLYELLGWSNDLRWETIYELKVK